jgi:hypothetical protein
LHNFIKLTGSKTNLRLFCRLNLDGVEETPRPTERRHVGAGDGAASGAVAKLTSGATRGSATRLGGLHAEGGSI